MSSSSEDRAAKAGVDSPVRLSSVVPIALVLLGCAPGPGQPRTMLDVYAAASLRDALAAAVAEYGARQPEIGLNVVAGSSVALRVQIEHGAPADLYLAADEINPQALAAAGLTAGRPVAFASSRLVIAVPADNPARIASVADLGRTGVRIVAAHEAVPLTRYTRELLERAAALPDHAPDLPERYLANVASREDDARAVLTKLELGEGDAAIVYATDARSSSSVGVIALPDEVSVQPVYTGVVLAGSADRPNAAAFLDWLAGPDGQSVLAGFGFAPP